MAAAHPSFSELQRTLEALLLQLEDPSLPLEEHIAITEEANRVLTKAEAALKSAELKVSKLAADERQ